MNRPSDRQILDFLAGEADPDSREEVLAWIESSPEHAREVRSVAAGLEAMHALSDAVGERATPRGRSVPAWWVPLAAAAAVAVAVPATVVLGRGPAPEYAGQPVAPDPSFVVTLHGVWPDAPDLEPSVVQARASEYWGWTSDLAARGILVAAGDLRWEPGVWLAAGGPIDPAASQGEPGFLVGMFTIRAASYDEAQRIASECPHLRYGGTVSVRRVGGGFVTVDGRGDWTS